MSASMKASQSAIRAVLKKGAGASVQGVQEGVLSKVWARSTELTIDRGEGCYVFDIHGNKYMDAAAGIAVLNTGHSHPKVVAALKEQAEKLVHSQINNYHNEPLYEFTRRIGAHLPEGLNHIYLDNTGTAGIEAAVKLVRQHTKRPHVIVLFQGMHGRSGLCSAMTSNHSIRNPLYYPLPSGFYQAPFPSAFRWKISEEEATERAVSGLRDVLRGNVRPDQVAALVFEPILGEGGFVPINAEYYRRVKELCDQHGILMVMDEIQAGYGRSGKMWAHQHFCGENVPDVMVSSKGIASGMPLSMVAAKKHVMDSFTPGTHGGTFNGNVMSLAAACATLDVFEEEGIVENSRVQGNTLKGTLSAIFAEHMPGSDVRGYGLMIGVECVNPEAAAYIKKHCFMHSNVIILSPTGLDGSILRIMPPLTINEEQVIALSQAIEFAVSDWKKGVMLQ
eukprot:TRINITY_DN1366_c0_g6_i1.p1 TRINITY_DN1366_c0_g6~~TRINITY_DN1366_c0_g6_i1.p1  ORF type:complete len:449 (+),score=170.08 TRINITY_DN1366_c0_g6_i1:136-1482(+)